MGSPLKVYQINHIRIRKNEHPQSHCQFQYIMFVPSSETIYCLKKCIYIYIPEVIMYIYIYIHLFFHPKKKPLAPHLCSV